MIEAGEHFQHFKGTPSSEPETFNVPERMEPKDASCAVVDHASGENFMMCVWHAQAGVSDADAHAYLGKLTKEIGDCLGSGGKQHPAPGGFDGGRLLPKIPCTTAPR